MLEEIKIIKEDGVLEVAPIFVGIDVSKARLDVAVRPSGQSESASNDQAGIEALVKRLGESNLL